MEGPKWRLMDKSLGSREEESPVPSNHGSWVILPPRRSMSSMTYGPQQATFWDFQSQKVSVRRVLRYCFFD